MLGKNILDGTLVQGFRQIRLANGIDEAGEGQRELQAQAEALRADPGVSRRDALDIAFVTLDPASSTDLDQAFALSRDGDIFILQYAIADVSAFVARGSAIEVHAWQQGLTVYSPDGSVPLYPRVLSSNKASLLPDGPRPAVLLTVHINPQGDCALVNCERAWVRSRAKLSYDAVLPGQLSLQIGEVARRINLAEQARGAFRMEREVQEVFADTDSLTGWNIRFAQRFASEDQNAALSLAANLAVAAHLFASGCGLFRVMDEPSREEMSRLRDEAQTLGVVWAQDEGLRAVVARLDHSDRRHSAFALAVRRTGGGARYMKFPLAGQPAAQLQRNAQHAGRPWHSAIAATYAHATAPMRRLADRYVLDLLVAQFARESNDQSELDALLSRLPTVMEPAERRAAKIDRDCVELVESRLLEPLIGRRLEALVIEQGKDSFVVQIAQPAVTWRVRTDKAAQLALGDAVKLDVVALTATGGSRSSLPHRFELRLTDPYRA